MAAGSSSESSIRPEITTLNCASSVWTLARTARSEASIPRARISASRGGRVDGAHLVYGYREFKTTSFRTAIKQLDVRSLQESFVTSLWTDGTPNVEIPGGWSADSRSILSNFWRYRKGHAAVARLPLTAAPTAERAAQVLVSSTENWLWQADESPDGRWVCYQQMPKLEGRYSALFVVPAAGGAARALTDNTSWDDKPRWSSDGRFIYFLSTRSGSLDVWAVGFDASHGRPTGLPFQVKGSPGFGATVAGIDEAELSIAGARAAVPVQNLNGGIWILQ
jgi:hypothetical protein